MVHPQQGDSRRFLRGRSGVGNQLGRRAHNVHWQLQHQWRVAGSSLD
jgi:hypothetical protein